MTQLADNPYAPPTAEVRDPKPRGNEDEQVWREGRYVAFLKGARFPDRCVVCNRPAEHRLRKTLTWHHPAYFVAVLFALLLYVVVALLVNKKAKVDFGLCHKHCRRRTRGFWIGYLGFFLSVAAMIFGWAVLGGKAGNSLGLTGLFCVLACPITGGIMATVMTPRRIRRDEVRVSVGKAFTRSLS